MDNQDQLPFDDDAALFFENPEPRCPCLLLLDTSGSMRGDPIRELNLGLDIFKEQLMSDGMAVKRVEIAVVSFGPVSVVSDFQTADRFEAKPLVASGDTPMGSAIERGIRMINDRKATYRQNGITSYRPWIFLITDGGPTDSWSSARNQVHQGETQNSFLFFAVGVEGANFDVLRQITVREPLQLKGLDFRGLFQWLSGSLSSVSRSSPTETPALVNPTAPNGWAVAG